MRAVAAIAGVNGLTLAVLMLCLGLGLAPNFDTRLVQLGEFFWPGYASELREELNSPDCSAVAQTRCDPEKPAAAHADVADPFAEESGSDCATLRREHESCVERQHEAARRASRITAPVRAYRAVELLLSEAAAFRFWRHLLCILVLLGAVAATVQRKHIALRSPETRWERRWVDGSLAFAHGLLWAACWADWKVQRASAAEAPELALGLLWMMGWSGLTALNIWQIFQPAALPPRHGQSSVPRVMMAVPLYVYMVVLAGWYFLAVEQHPSGLAIYLHKVVQHPQIYVGIGLYVWAGMALAQTSVVARAFAILRPWQLPPELAAWLVAVVSAVPVAYSGASGIFVVATGGVVFAALREAGASPRLALAATAMSGSLGVVLRPCLIVVLIAALNKQVTTDALFSRGLYVFGLTSALYLVAMWWRKATPWRLPPLTPAVKESARALRSLWLPATLLMGVVGAYALIFQLQLNEHNAAFILPVVMLLWVLFEHRAAQPWRRVGRATAESSHQLGALLMVMVGSVAFGGVVERAEVMDRMPQHLGSPLVAMAFLVVVMVVVGMLMDPLGAVIVVSVTLAPLALANGIEATHFWVMVLVAFELGYLTPPVALNLLLARQAIGAEAEVERLPVESGWFDRHEHVVLPVLVMGSALLLVAFVPLLW